MIWRHFHFPKDKQTICERAKAETQVRTFHTIVREWRKEVSSGFE